MENKVDIKENYIHELNDKLLEILLKDHSSNKNILWATDNYKHKGTGYYAHDNITLKAITGRNGLVIKPRVEKSKKEQDLRIKQKAEVFTPSWICNDMANNLDETWFEKQGVFNVKNDKTWTVNTNKIPFTKKTWQDYVKLKVLEISCGEAPFLVSRYDTVTGKWLDVNERIGMLDRKLRVVNENTDNADDWLYWATEAFKATFGYEWQGDSLLIARENLLFTFIDYYSDRFNTKPTDEQLIEIAKILSWNIWQMDGLKYVIPNSCKPVPKMQLSIFEDEEPEECPSCKKGNNHSHTGIYSKIMNWDTKRSIKFYKGEKKMKFDFVIGNPPYQEDIENRGEQPPIYHLFYDNAFKISNIVTLITPGRFLFNVGKTPTEWNKKMLNDEHFKVLQYWPSSKSVFNQVDIMGGVAIGYRDSNKIFGAIKTYTQNQIMKNILNMVKNKNELTIDTILFSNTSYKYNPSFFSENPGFETRVSGGSKRYLSSSVFDKFPEVFFKDKPNNKEEYAYILGRQDNKRAYYYLKRDYLNPPNNFENYKVFIPSSNGCGAVGEVNSTPVIGAPIIGNPMVGTTETFISLGNFKNKNEAYALLKYIKTKFCRMMLGTKKVTQGNKNAETWSNVPLQNFTDKSDIDWSKSIKEIDNQLYKKYGLEDDEINFIETHIKEMD